MQFYNHNVSKLSISFKKLQFVSLSIFCDSTFFSFLFYIYLRHCMLLLFSNMFLYLVLTYMLLLTRTYIQEHVRYSFKFFFVCLQFSHRNSTLKSNSFVYVCLFRTLISIHFSLTLLFTLLNPI